MINIENSRAFGGNNKRPASVSGAELVDSSKLQQDEVVTASTPSKVDLIVGKFNQVQFNALPPPPPELRAHGPRNNNNKKFLQSHGDLMQKLNMNNIQRGPPSSTKKVDPNRRRSETSDVVSEKLKTRKLSFKQHHVKPPVVSPLPTPLKSPCSMGIKLPELMVSTTSEHVASPTLDSPPVIRPANQPRSQSAISSAFVYPSMMAPTVEGGPELGDELLSAKTASLDRRCSAGVCKSSPSRGFMRKLRKSSMLNHSSCDGHHNLNQNDPIDPTDFSKSVEEDDTNTENTTSSSNDTGKNKKKKDKKKSKAPSRHGSDAKNADKVRNKLKKFIGKRPTFESLQERGIIKETVFGCPLDKLCEKEQSTVPKFIKLCVDEVEKRGLDVDGIYRVSGNLSHVQRLRYLIDRDETPDLGLPEWEDIHLITGALKMFLRELPEPVIPFNFFDKFIAACKLSSEKERVTTMKGLVKVLPRANADTLKYLLEHFRRVVEHSHQNRMLVQNIAIVFGPTLLLKPPDTNPDPMAAASGGHMAVYMVYQNQIIDTMLTEYLTIFH